MEKIKALMGINKSLKEILVCEGCKSEETPQAVKSLDHEINTMLLVKSKEMLNVILDTPSGNIVEAFDKDDMEELRDLISQYIG